jgi:hypothetical protein
MLQQSRRLLHHFSMVLLLFTLLAVTLASLVRYTSMLETTIIKQQAVAHNTAAMGISVREIEKSSSILHQLLPPGYKSQSAEKLIYTRLDSLTKNLQAIDVSVKPIETHEGFLLLEFSATVPISSNVSCTTTLNRLGQQETLAFPLVSIQSVNLEHSVTSNGLVMKIEGTLKLPAQISGISA